MNKLQSKALIGVGSVFFLLTGGCGGGPSGGSTQQQNPTPVLNSIGPNSVSAGSPTLALTATGSGFISSSVVQWNGSSLATTYGSGTSLTAQVPASDLTAQGSASVTVVNPAPGGGTSGAQTFTINVAANPVPAASSLSPATASAGSSGLILTVSGTNFISSSQVQWNGSPLTTTYGSGTSLTAQVPASDLTAQGTASVTVVNPAPGGGTSGAQTFTISAAANPVPMTSSLSPTSANAGSPGLTLTVTGTNFVSSSLVQWNGSSLATTYGSGTSLTAQVPASDLAAQGTASVTVVNPTPGGGTSNALPFEISAPGNHLTEISTPVNHIVWDATHGLLYATLPHTGTNPDAVVAINPVTAAVGTPVAAGNSPDLLALSTDDSFLYVSLDGTPSIVRFNLPALTLDPGYNLPAPTSPISMAVAPGSPHTIATIFGQSLTLPPNATGTFIFDDTTARASSISSYDEESTSLVWGANASALYATDNTSGADLFVNAVNSTGVTLVEDYGGVMRTQADGTLHFDPVSGNVYSDEGHVVDPANGNLVGTFNLNSLYFGVPMDCVPDIAHNLVFFLGQSPAQFTAASGVTILAFNATTYQLVATLPIDGISGYPANFLRWGNAGLAFTMSNTFGLQSPGSIYLLDGSFVSASAAPDFTVGTAVDVLPTLASISPQDAAAGSSGVTLNVTGSNFESGTSILWNGTPLETTFISTTSLEATIPPSALATAGNASVTVSNGSDGSSAGSLAFTVTPAIPGNTNLLAVNLASLDIAWDAAGNQLIAPVWSADPQYANSIVAINPVTGAVTKSIPVAIDPTMARITSDDSYVYTGFKAVNQVTRLALPGLSAPDTFSLGSDSVDGPWYALDLQPAPGAPFTTAVTLGTNGASPPQGPLVIYDNGVQLPTRVQGFGPTTHIFNDLQWGANASTLYADDNYDSDNYFYTLAVNSSGVTLTNTVANAFGGTGSKIHSDSTTGYIYDDNGQVINPVTAAPVGNFNASGLLVPDDTLNRVFILGQTAAQSGTANYSIQSFDQTTFAAVKSITVTGVLGTPVALTRWGADGLAFVTYNKNAGPANGPAGMLYIISDVGFVSANARPADARPFALVRGFPRPVAGNPKRAKPVP